MTSTATGKSIEIKKGVLDNSENHNYTSGERVTIFKHGEDGESAQKMFEFTSQNTSVEWSNTKTEDKGSLVGTSHQESTELASAQIVKTASKDGDKVLSSDHSHPKNTGPSGFDANGKPNNDIKKSDAKFATTTGEAKLRVFLPGTQKYIPYDKDGVK